ncbi:SRPBCC family protein [Stackebrandtia nassauensis]|uniref:Activator of Hsp90 ATPase 1 family protein n=1 Tax=Stackebrandtia nassauensis (strain DSM 44728 / CIP 108903 / NRRL B-16338 / NBRC 102104 / LLR-40K-21) TaxID=446470 RepID=D3Q249_STANL|nr:SRPBCC domain-containing protein [Stackebrandtia nassauensis]ADD41916.1 Activator of Hsp90 ATPase 1 family protein [Stackebrandtia nassauensis DSM 44728]
MSTQTHGYSLTRELDAPVANVWRVWTQPSDYEQWAYAVPGSVELDVRVGGAWKALMQAPDGGQFPLTGSYREVAENQRLVMAMDIPGAEPALMNLELEDLDGKTRITLSQECGTAEERDQAEQGSNMLLDSCTAYVEKL